MIVVLEGTTIYIHLNLLLALFLGLANGLSNALSVIYLKTLIDF
jgi:hypothetical protein